MSMGVLPVCVDTICFLCLLGLEEGIGSPSNGVTDSRESPCGCWEPNLGSLEEQPVLIELSYLSALVCFY